MTLRRKAIISLFYILCSAVAHASEPVAVRVQALQDVVVYPQVRLAAVTVPQNDSKISAQVAASVARIHVLVGSQVERGAILVELDNDDLKAALQQAQAAIDAVDAKLSLAKYRATKGDTLLKRNSIAEEDAKQREADLATLTAERAVNVAELERAKIELNRTKVRAPFDGSVVARSISVGEWAVPGTPLIRLVSDEGLEVSVRMQSRDVPLLSNATDLTFLSEQRSYALRLRAVGKTVGAEDRLREVRFVFVDGAPLAGQSGELVLQVGTAHIPARLLVQRGTGFGFFEFVEGKAQFVRVEGERGQPVAVSDIADRMIISDGRERLQNNYAVKPVESISDAEINLLPNK